MLENIRICIDIDGTICKLRQEAENYKDLKPIDGAADKIKELKKQGAYIILCTARHMKSCDSNIGKVIAKQGHTLIDWLFRFGFEYDELWFGKPYANLYIDDKAFKFEGSWDSVNEELIKTYVNDC